MNYHAYPRCILALLLAVSATLSTATEVAGIKLDDTVHVANTELKLNGAGIRYKAIFKVYVAGLYLTEKKTTVPEVLAAAGPRRVTIVMLRDLSNEDFGRGFMDGIRKNTDKVEKSKLTSQFLRFGELFASVPELKKGDIMTNDWIPGVGTIVSLNGKKMGEPYPDIAFYNALLRIWLGESPVDSGLKKAMLAESEGRSTFR
ncbi:MULTISPECIES: chalcone isomerase family protein [unclassified Undibacterium]|uniref:chalcone isomerase family protein n=1 Tax=unclassified Undibacterium TaxID=2630295 RepID=UPI002AC8CC10|nr:MULTISPECIES: chalcone isomerase family protein [unclassified Undibacterium]MEB0139901.1 chalcone isomerase family protein [Undibacterium sp. CCC2.1]MEB0171830.1 chalcone isomerase family protein [Undibacterium sp. CCC1.1]MEB0175646.1 chalcone isomerase family protein [Undibacterium sp. CCC3.4]MEB0216228.1 chalcone isomerase family protein [Undibacterium sp. 5I2]WPX44121.1 chalcone isomerase family protein [Undibacterium sp. CCC3.4]